MTEETNEDNIKKTIIEYLNMKIEKTDESFESIDYNVRKVLIEEASNIIYDLFTSPISVKYQHLNRQNERVLNSFIKELNSLIGEQECWINMLKRGNNPVDKIKENVFALLQKQILDKDVIKKPSNFNLKDLLDDENNIKWENMMKDLEKRKNLILNKELLKFKRV